jgi:hypothetical protein
MNKSTFSFGLNYSEIIIYAIFKFSEKIYIVWHAHE